MGEVTDPTLLNQLNSHRAPAPAQRTPQPIVTLPNLDQQHDNSVQDAGAQNDAQRLFLQQQEAARKQAEWDATHNPDGSPRQDVGQATEDQRKASNFYGRMLTSEAQYRSTPGGDRDARTAVGQWFHDAAPGVDATLNSNGRVTSDNAARNWIAASLRQESGAAISQGEFDNQYRIFFPMPGDGPDQIRQKEIARQQAMLGFKTGAGPLAGSAEQQYQAQFGNTMPWQMGGNPPSNGGTGGGNPSGGAVQPGADGAPPNPFGGLPGNSKEPPVGLYDANGNFVGQDPRIDQTQTPPPGMLYRYRDANGDIVNSESIDGGNDPAPAPNKYEADLKTALNKAGAGDPTEYQNWLMRAAQGSLFGLSDEVNGAHYALNALIKGENPVAAYKIARDLEQMRQHINKQGQGWTGTAVELGGSLPTAAMFPMGEGVSGAVKAGAGMGGVSGFGNGNGTADSFKSAVTGTLLGGATGGLVQKAAPMVAAGLRKVTGRAAPGEGAQVIQAADRLNELTGSKIAPIPADVSGPGIRNATAGMAKMPLAAQPIIKGSEEVSTEAQAARDYVAKLAGDPASLEASGESALNGARAYITRSRNKVNSLYKKAENLGGDTPVDLVNAREVLDGHIAELSQTPGGAPGLDVLKGLRSELDGQFPVEGVKRMRTALRDRFGTDGLRGSDLERRVGQVADAANMDVTNSLTKAGKADAAKAYEEAAAAHADRVDVIDHVLAPIIGRKSDAPLSGEQIMGKIGTLTKTNNQALSKFLTSIPEEDAATVRATLISRLGTASKGTQNAAGDAFSLPQFLTHWNDMTPAAKSTLFGGQLRSALDDLAVVAEGTKGAQKFANVSNTGSPVGIGLTGLTGAAVLSHPLAATFAVLSQYGGGKLLASPAFARWLVRMPKEARPALMHVQQLVKIAVANPAIGAEARDLQRQLVAAFEGGPLPLAAQPGQNQSAAKPTTIPVPR
jgi:hypothetical protein